MVDQTIFVLFFFAIFSDTLLSLDVIIKINDKQVSSINDLKAAVDGYDGTEPLQVKVIRFGEQPYVYPTRYLHPQPLGLSQSFA